MSVKVAIRVRPFNQRETFLGCISCVDMRQNTTVLYENRQKNKKQHYFTFDYSLWSHDEFSIRQDGYMYPTSNKYVDQQKVYNLIGKEILENSWQGYNCCLFAYGQTGAGKSYSMIGYGVNRGIIPMVCEQLFEKIKKNQRKGEKQYQITLSMLEIYNQKVQDLFTSTSKRPPNGLKIRQNKTLGVYVEGLTKLQVFSYSDIERRMEQGSKNRSLASTLMNQYSSRAHTIIMLEFVQKQWINKLKMNKKSSYINLVDLAGSQRVAKTGICGNKDRLKQASNINKSLHTLGRVIQTLAQQAASTKGKILQVPYRDSSLTRILEGALGGNSKTIMICAISPANDNYEQTLSTLRYADQTKKIKNKPIVNQSAVDKIIRQLRQQNDRLKKILETSQQTTLSTSREFFTETDKKQMRSNLKASMRQVQKEIKKNMKSFAINTNVEEQQESLMMTEFTEVEEPSFSEMSFDFGNKAQVYITNLNEDEQLNYKVRYSCEKDILITNKNNKKSIKGMEQYAKIVLCGLGIQQNHAKIYKKGEKYYIQALSQISADYTLLNGKPVYDKRQLEHNDRIIMGINSVFVFKNNLKRPEKEKFIDYEYVINERQQQMQNMSLIPPTSMSLFISNNLLRGTPTKDIYSPPNNAYNNTKKLFEQENQKQILDKLSDIQLQFSKLVKQNQQKIKQKEEYYRAKLNQMKSEKEKERREKNHLQEKLMLKSIQSETLKSKNSQLEKLKQKLSKYNDEKDRRKKLRQSMLLQSDDKNGVIQEDIIGEFIDVEDPRLRGHQIGIGPDPPTDLKTKMGKNKNNKVSFKDNSQSINEAYRSRNGSNFSNQSLLLIEEDQVEKDKNKQDLQRKAELEQIMELQAENSNMKSVISKKRQSLFQFRRLYNIKILSQIQNQITCSECQKSIPIRQSKQELNSPKHQDILQNYSANSYQNANLEEFHFKNQAKKKNISHQQMAALEKQIQELESKLISKQNNLNDEMLLNYSMDRRDSRQSFGARLSYDQRKFSDSYGEINLNLTQDLHALKSKSNLKILINDFIQVLAETQELQIYHQTPLKIEPSPPIYRLSKHNQIEYKIIPTRKLSNNSIHRELQINFKLVIPRPERLMQYLKYQSLNMMIEGTNKRIDYAQLNHQQEQIQSNQQHKIQRQNNKQISQFCGGFANNLIPLCQIGINTDSYEEQSIHERYKGNSFTAFLNEEFQQTNNQTYNIEPIQRNNQQRQRQLIKKQYAEISINTQENTENKRQTQQRQTQSIHNQKEMVSMEVITDINMQTYQQFQQSHSGQLVDVDVICQKVQKNDENDQEQDNIPKQTGEKIIETEQQAQDQQEILQQYIKEQQNELNSEINDTENNANIDRQSNSSELEKYLQNQKQLSDKSMNTSSFIPQTTEIHTNTQTIQTKSQSVNTSILKEKLTIDKSINTSFIEENDYNNTELQIENYLNQNEEDQIEKYLIGNDDDTQNNRYSVQIQDEVDLDPQVNQRKDELLAAEMFEKIAAQIKSNKLKNMSLSSQQITHTIQTEIVQLPKQQQLENSQNRSPINDYQQEQSKQPSQIKVKNMNIINQTVSILIQPQSKIQPQQSNYKQDLVQSKIEEFKPEMIDEEIQINIRQPNQQEISENIKNRSLQNSYQQRQQKSDKSSSNQYEAKQGVRQKSHTHFEAKAKSINTSQEIADKFNLSFSEIEKHQLSYQEMSVMGFDTLLKQDDLNNKIKQLEDKIKQLQSNQSSNTLEKDVIKQGKYEPVVEEQLIPEMENIDFASSIISQSKERQDNHDNSKYIPLKKNKKKKKKNQMTEEEKKQHDIEKEIQAKIIQCNNENLINQRNLQIHKRKRQAEQLHKMLLKKQKIQLQKQLLILIPMIRRFNLIANQMKRLIEAKISIEYRNFSHYEMIEVLKNYSVNKKHSGSTIQIKIVVLNCEEGRIYTWPSEMFKNRYEIAQQTFEKYLQNNQDLEKSRRRYEGNNQKAQDPFWDPVDFVPQGVGYLSMEVLLYNLSYEGYISIIYKTHIIAKVYISISPLKVKKHNDEQQSVDIQQQSELDHIEIYNQRNLLQKDIYFTISIQSIKFMKNDQRQKLDQSTSNINLTSLNSNIIKYTISYQLLEKDYKLVTFTTPEVDFVEEKQFKRIDYMRRHSFQNMSESTLAYISDCPIKFTLNVMKDYNEECLNASFNNEEYSQDNDHSQLDKSSLSHEDKNSIRSRQNSQASVKDQVLKNIKSDFSKKPAVIFENTQLVTKLENDAKKQQQKRDKIRKLEDSRNKNKDAKGQKDKQCNIY